MFGEGLPEHAHRVLPFAFSLYFTHLHIYRISFFDICKNTIFSRNFQDVEIVTKIVISRVNILKLGGLDMVNLSVSMLRPVSVPTTPTRHFLPSFLNRERNLNAEFSFS